MILDQLRKLYYAEPFQQFLVRLTDGREYFVEKPEYLSFSPAGRTFTVQLPDDDFEIIDASSVATLEEIGSKVMSHQ